MRFEEVKPLKGGLDASERVNEATRDIYKAVEQMLKDRADRRPVSYGPLDAAVLDLRTAVFSRGSRVK